MGLGSVAFAVEVFAWSERHADSALARMLRLPGHEIQRVFGTREPDAGAARRGAGRARGDPARGGSRGVTTEASRTRLDPAVFRLPVERIREGYYSDAYFNFTKELLETAARLPRP